MRDVFFFFFFFPQSHLAQPPAEYLHFDHPVVFLPTFMTLVVAVAFFVIDVAFGRLFGSGFGRPFGFAECFGFGEGFGEAFGVAAAAGEPFGVDLVAVGPAAAAAIDDADLRQVRRLTPMLDSILSTALSASLGTRAPAAMSSPLRTGVPADTPV